MGKVESVNSVGVYQVAISQCQNARILFVCIFFFVILYSTARFYWLTIVAFEIRVKLTNEASILTGLNVRYANLLSKNTIFHQTLRHRTKCFRVYESYCELRSNTNIYSWQYGRIKFDRHFNIANIHVVYIFFMRKTFRDESMFYANILTKYSLNWFYLEICYLCTYTFVFCYGFV